MIGRMIDSAIAAISPQAGLKRLSARKTYGEVSRAYDAAKSTRVNKNWKPANSSADRELSTDADTIRARARDLVRNNAYARGVIRAVVRNVIGSGIKPQACVYMANGKPREKFNDAAEWLFDRWQRRCDVSGRLSFYEMQQMVLSERWEAGECLVRFVTDVADRSVPVPLQLELIDADRLVSDRYFGRSGQNPETGNEVRRGVEVDRNGRAVAYWLYTSNPNDLNSLYPKETRYPAGDFLHLFKPTRIGQTRGVSEFSPIMRWCHGLHRYVDHEQIAKEVYSCLSVLIKTLDGAAEGGFSGSSGDDTTDTNGNAFEFIEPGLVARLMPGEDVTVVNPSRGESEAAAWISLMLRSMGVGTGLSYERLTRDYSQTNYSSNRAGDLEDRREFRMEHQWVVEHFCRPVWERFIAAAVMAGVDQFPSPEQFVAKYADWTEHKWQSPRWEWVDPQKEATANQLALDSNQTTLQEVIGPNWREVLEQRAMEKQYAKELGLTTEAASATEQTGATAYATADQ